MLPRDDSKSIRLKMVVSVDGVDNEVAQFMVNNSVGILDQVLFVSIVCEYQIMANYEKLDCRKNMMTPKKEKNSGTNSFSFVM